MDALSAGRRTESTARFPFCDLPGGPFSQMTPDGQPEGSQAAARHTIESTTRRSRPLV